MPLTVYCVLPAAAGFGMFERAAEGFDAPEGVETVQDYIDFCREIGAEVEICNDISGLIYGEDGGILVKTVEAEGPVNYALLYAGFGGD